MFIWVAVEVEDKLPGLEKKAVEVESIIKFKDSNINTLPLHVSLKISSEIDKSLFDNVINDLTNLLSNKRPFIIDVDKIELHDTICWIKMKENESLVKLHKELCDLFLNKYSSPLHKFDHEFTYHTTLFLDSDKAKVKDAFLRIKDFALPKTILANKFVIGYSENGQIGTYRVYKEINAYEE